jgi:hypothetical protein
MPIVDVDKAIRSTTPVRIQGCTAVVHCRQYVRIETSYSRAELEDSNAR